MPALPSRSVAPPLAAGACGVWSAAGCEVTADRLEKFWNDLPLEARRVLLRIDRQTLFEHARKNHYCSRCNGLLQEGYVQIVMHGKMVMQDGSTEHHFEPLKPSCIQVDGNVKLKNAQESQDPSVHPWGGLATTRDGMLTLLDCFLCAKSLRMLQKVFDNARAREREREMLYPDACGAGGRGWISRGIVSYGRGHGMRDTCALHTARLSCDTLVDFWSALTDETKFSLLRMKEDDFIERLMYRFDSKRFCRDCRRNVIRELKELKELRRIRRELYCTSSFCVADTDFIYEVTDDSVRADWHQSFPNSRGVYHHFEWAIGSAEGKYDILDFKDVGVKGGAEADGLDLAAKNACFITVRACKHNGRCTEVCVKAHALKGHSCVHRSLIVGDGFVTISPGESIREFFEQAEEAEDDDEESMEKDEDDMDSDMSRPQKHAKSPELAREFLLDAAMVIFKEQVEKAFKEGTARQNAHSVFVCLALKMLEDRVHVACKDIITLEKQIKLLEEEEIEKREEEKRKEKRRLKEREKKLRRKERLKEKEREKDMKLVGLRSCDTSSLNESPSMTSLHDDSPNTADSVDSLSELEDTDPCVLSPSPAVSFEGESSGVDYSSNNKTELSSSQDSIEGEYKLDANNQLQREGSLFCEESSQELYYSQSGCQSTFSNHKCNPYSEYDTASYRSASKNMNGMQRFGRDRYDKSSAREFNPRFNDRFQGSKGRMRERDDYSSCSCGHRGDYVLKDHRSCNSTMASSEVQRPYYRNTRYGNYMPTDFSSKGNLNYGTLKKDRHVKLVWEPTGTRKQNPTDCSASALESGADPDGAAEVTKDISQCSSKADPSFDHILCPEKSSDCNSNRLNGSDAVIMSVDSKDCREQEDSTAVSEVIHSKSKGGTNSSSIDNFSSTSEEDTATSSSSALNAESSLTSDSEDAAHELDESQVSRFGDSGSSKVAEVSSGVDNSKANACSITFASSSAQNSCTKIHISPETPASIYRFDCAQVVGEPVRLQNHILPGHAQAVQVGPPFSLAHSCSPASWVVPPNGFVPYPQPYQFIYPGHHLVYGQPPNRPGFTMHLDGVQTLATPVYRVNQHPMYNQGTRITHLVKGQHPSHETSFPDKEVPSLQPSSEFTGINTQKAPVLPNEAQPFQSETQPFSLFHFGGPVACETTGSVPSKLCTNNEELSSCEVGTSKLCPEIAKEMAAEEYKLF